MARIWCMFDGTDFHCERCGERAPVKLPIQADQLLAISDLFTFTHAKCEPRPESRR